MKRTPAALRHLEDRLPDLERRGLLRTRPDAGRRGRALVLLERLPGARLRPGATRPFGVRGVAADRGGAPRAPGARGGRRRVASGTERAALLERLRGQPGDPRCAGPAGRPRRQRRAQSRVPDRWLQARSGACRDRTAPRRLGRRGHPPSRRTSGRVWVLTESYFSMDADTPDLLQLRELCDRAGAALLVDEAHALGVFGPDGRGRCAELDVVPDVLVGTLGKSFGAAGAFVAGCEPLTDWLWNRARSFVFSTGASPIVAAAALAALPVVASDAGRRGHLLENARRLRGGLLSMGLSVRGVRADHSDRDRRRAARRPGRCRARVERSPSPGRAPPTVPPGTARLRVTVTATHTAADIDRALLAFEQCIQCLLPSS